MTLIISCMLLWGLFPSMTDLEKTGLTFLLLIVWVIRNRMLAEVR